MEEKKRIIELKEYIKTYNMKKRGVIHTKKMNRASDTYGNITKGLILM